MPGYLALRLLWRDWKGGELTLLVAALMLAVTSVSGIAIFIDRLQQALVLESTAFLAADRRIEASRPIPPAFRELAAKLAIDTADTLSFPSILFAGDRNQLVSVKAVTAGYPLRGTLRVAQEAFVPGLLTEALPGPGEVWLDGRLLPALDVTINEQLELGNAQFRLAAVITDEPDRGGSFFDLGPRLLMRMEDVAATGVVQPGSRLTYGLLLRGTEDALQVYRDSLPDDFDIHYDWDDIRSSNDSIGMALNRAEQFMLLGGLLAVILAGIAVALAANRYSYRQYDSVAVLKTLGVTPGQIQRLYLGKLLCLGVLTTAMGLAFGYGMQIGILWVLKELVPVVLPPPGSDPFIVGALSGLVCLLSFALPPLLRLRSVAPLRVIRRDPEPTGTATATIYLAGCLGSLTLLLWYSGSLALTGWLLLGSGGTVLCLLAVASLLLRSGRLVGMQAGSVWRLALAGLQRRRSESRIQILAFGLAFMLLLIIYLIRTALLEEWRGQLSTDTPNHFVFNVAPSEVKNLQHLLETEGQGVQPFFPMMRGRVLALNGALLDPDGPRRWLTRERNLSWAATLPGGNTLIEGAWWSDTADILEVSMDVDYARSNNLEIGDLLTFSIADMTLEARLVNLRRVDWDSMRPNFFMLLSPGALDALPATYLTSFRLEAARKVFLNELLRSFPTVTVIELDAVVGQVQRIVERVTMAVEVLLLLVLGAGALVLIASIQSSMDERLREYGLLRALGADRGRILGALVIEFSALGLFAGLIAALGAEGTVFLLQEQLFRLTGQLHPWIWFGGPLFGIAVIGVIGTLATRSLVATPPAIVLREVS